MRTEMPTISSLTPRLRSPSIAAASEGSVTAVRKLYRHAADVNVEDESGYTPLFAASRHGHAHVVRTLCDLGADVHKAGVGNCSPLYVAAQRGHVDVVRILCEKGADLNTEAGDCGHTALTVALQQGHLDVVRALCTNGADVNKPAYGRTPLLLAVELGMKEMVSTLCRHGADVRRMDISGHTPLNIAVQSGNTDMVRFLCEIGADVNVLTLWQSPMASAAELGDVEMLKLLRAYGADLDREDVSGSGHTPLSIAAKEGHVEVVCFLIQQGADVDLMLSNYAHGGGPRGRNAIECAIFGLDDIADNLASLSVDHLLSIAARYHKILKILLKSSSLTTSRALTLYLQAANNLLQGMTYGSRALEEGLASCIMSMLSATSHVGKETLAVMNLASLRPMLESRGILDHASQCVNSASLKRLAKFAIRSWVHRPLPLTLTQTGLPSALQKYVLLELPY